MNDFKECNCEKEYKKYNPTEKIKVGDIISLEPNSNTVKLAFNKGKNQDKEIIRNLFKNRFKSCFCAK